MTGLLMNLALATFLIALGAMCGGYLVHRRLVVASRATVLLDQLKVLPPGQTEAVEEHTKIVRQLEELLHDSDTDEAAAIVRVIAELLDSNHQIRRQLSVAEDELHKQTQSLLEQRLEARTDALTGLANRRVFDEELARCFSDYQNSGRPLSTLLIDVDHFKDFNDTQGHRAGDEVLRRVAGLIRKAVRETDTAARYGGEEFGVILPGTPLLDARKAAERIRISVMETMIRFESKEHHITVSVGTAQVAGRENIELYLQRIDEALYSAKNLGRNCTCYHDGIRPHGKNTDPNDGPYGGNEERATEHRPYADCHSDISVANVYLSCQQKPIAGAREEIGVLAPGDRLAYLKYVERRLAEWKRGGPVFALAFIKIDAYDLLVEREGDTVAEEVFEIIVASTARSVRAMDTMIRLAPDTLGLLLPKMTTANAGVVWHRICEQAESISSQSKGLVPAFTLSVGVASAQDGDDWVRVIDRTTEALEVAESEVGNRCYCHNNRWPEEVVVAAPSCESTT